MLLKNSKKIVIKLGSSTVVDSKGKFKKSWVTSLIKDIQRYKQESDIVIVSSGAIALGQSYLRIKKKKSDIGILVCGSGTGMAITSNKVKSVRAAQCYSKSSTVLARQHNNANIICLGSRMITRNEAFKFISLFLKTKFEGGRHQKRINKI